MHLVDDVDILALSCFKSVAHKLLLTYYSMLSRILESRVFKGLQSNLSAIYDQLVSLLWPLYSSGIVVGAVCFVASVYEKSILVNLTSISNSTFLQDQPENEIKQAGELMESMATNEIKRYVNDLSKQDFDELRVARNEMIA